MLIRRVISIILFSIWLLSAALSTTAASSSPPATAFVVDIAGKAVKGFPQSYPLSCESRSAVDLAAFWGVEIREREFLKHLPHSDNPEVGFVGDPNGVWGYTPPYSYGVHAGPVAELLKDYGIPARAHTGLTWADLQLEIAAGRPVIVWIIGEMWPGKATSYSARDGRRVQVANYEHTMILVGYNQKKVEMIDANTGRAKRYPLNTFLKSWQVLGNMAVTVRFLNPADLNNRVYLSTILLDVQARPATSPTLQTVGLQHVFIAPGYQSNANRASRLLPYNHLLPR